MSGVLFRLVSARDRARGRQSGSECRHVYEELRFAGVFANFRAFIFFRAQLRLDI